MKSRYLILGLLLDGLFIYHIEVPPITNLLLALILFVLCVWLTLRLKGYEI